MKNIRRVAVILILVLLLSALGCGAQSREEGTAPDNSDIRRQMQQYQADMKAFQAGCIGQLRAFSNSTQANDIKAGQAAADALKTELDGFDDILVPEACGSIQPYFQTAKEKTGDAYALMLQILGGGQYNNDDMAYMIALKSAVQVISDSCQSGFDQLTRAIEALG